MDITDEWVKSGDRSHPNLKLLDDDLRHRLTYFDYEDDLSKLERMHLSGNKFAFDRTLHKITQSQKLWEGDRSHPRIVELDALRVTLTYDGWERDCDQAEKEHLRCSFGYSFNPVIEGIRRKQAIHVGDRTHEDLQFLDSLRIRLSYPGCEEDFREAMRLHKKGHALKYRKIRMTERQRMFEGDRSNPRLVALDSLNLTYPGWQKDVYEVEKQHVGVNSMYCDQMLGRITDDYRALLTKLKRKQWEFVTGVQDTSSMHPIQRKIVETHWTFPGWQTDVKRIKERTAVNLYRYDLERCQLKQMIYDNDFDHHPALITLGGMQLSYPGWKTDMENVKHFICKSGYELDKESVDGQIKGMQNKQDVFNGFKCSRQKKANQSEDRFGNCSICWDHSCTHAFVPCGHLCVCQPCSQHLMSRGSKCPICRQTVTMAMEVFLP
ncbi:hypothetical protein ACHAXR_007074 [Thalassiosira sp. AJA248-18]